MKQRPEKKPLTRREKLDTAIFLTTIFLYLAVGGMTGGFEDIPAHIFYSGMFIFWSFFGGMTYARHLQDRREGKKPYETDD